MPEEIEFSYQVPEKPAQTLTCNDKSLAVSESHEFNFNKDKF